MKVSSGWVDWWFVIARDRRVCPIKHHGQTMSDVILMLKLVILLGREVKCLMGAWREREWRKDMQERTQGVCCRYEISKTMALLS